MEQINFIKKVGTKFIFECLHCGNPFVSPGYEVRAGRMTKYCSNKCQSISPLRRKNALEGIRKRDTSGKNNPNYKNGWTTYTKHRKKVCEMCGATSNINTSKPLYVHHIDENRQNSSPKNLVTVCASCHEKIHKRRWN